MLFCRISHNHINVETPGEFIALCIIILIMVGIAALIDFLRKPQKSRSADIEISIKIKCDTEKNSSEKNNVKHKTGIAEYATGKMRRVPHRIELPHKRKSG